LNIAAARIVNLGSEIEELKEETGGTNSSL
jgi:hypothetical protein